MTTELEFTEGMQFDKGYISPYFVTDPEAGEAVFDDPYLLITTQKISSVADLLPLLEKVAEAGKPLVVIAEDVDGEALSTLVVNSIRKTFTAVAVKAPFFGDRRKAFLQDLADRHRRPGHRPRGRAQARPGRPGRARPGRARRRHQGHHHGHARRRRAGARSTPASRRSGARSRTPTPTGTARSCRSGWPSWPAASASSRSARPPRSSSRSASTASRTPSRPPARRSRRASSPAAAPPWCRPRSALDGDLGLHRRRGHRRGRRPHRRWPSRCAGSPQRRATRATSSWRKVRELDGQPRPQRRDRRVRRPAGRRRRRPGEGDQGGAGQRGLGRGAGAHHAERGRREAGRGGAHARRRPRPLARPQPLATAPASDPQLRPTHSCRALQRRRRAWRAMAVGQPVVSAAVRQAVCWRAGLRAPRPTARPTRRTARGRRAPSAGSSR